MTYWTAWYADFPLTDESRRVQLFESKEDALDFVRHHWGPQYTFVQECVVRCPAVKT